MCCVCRTLSKIWPKNIDFTVTAIMLERGLFIGLYRRLFLQPPFTPRSDRCNLSCYFLELQVLLLTMYRVSSFESTTYKDH